MTEERIFHGALERTDPAERAAFLDESCGGDAGLRRRVEELLKAHDEPGDFLKAPAGADEGRAGVGVALTLLATGVPTGSGEAGPTSPFGPDPDPWAPARPGLRPIAEGPGDRIGPYILREKVGEGGMGVVYMAEQQAPIRRRVALKIIKPGMDTEQVIARFEAERQALALMDHPHIARVLDAGATSSGRPYFVMELVEGVPITDHCDACLLSPRERLELFLPVCAAIQHAHQKGVIHRDVKPSNVLVEVRDGRPVPKVIDFGVVKAVEQRLTERSLFTRFGAVVGTPEYMSPEQAGAVPDVDTRTDVYSLGVLLYELLTGTTPLDRETLRRAAMEEVLRRVREEEPPRPSTRLSGTGERLPTVAAVRSTEPARLARLVRGDLDWVVMKALEKDRARRYETAAALADDVRRHLDGDPVEAGPPSRAYRLRKFARKHRVALATATAFAALLLVATAVSAYAAWRAVRAEGLAEGRLGEVRRANAATQKALGRSEEARKQAEAVSKFLVEAFRSPDPGQDGRQVKVADLLDRGVKKLETQFTGSEETRGALLNSLGDTYISLGLSDKAVEVLRKACDTRERALGTDHRDTQESRNDLACAYLAAGRIAEALPLSESTLRWRKTHLGSDHPSTLLSSNNVASAYFHAGRFVESIALLEATVRQQERSLGPNDPDTLKSRSNLAGAYDAVGRLEESLALHESTLKRREGALGPDHPDTLKSRSNLASAYLKAGRTAEAIVLLESTLKQEERVIGPDHAETLQSRLELAVAYWEAGRRTESLALRESTLKRQEAALGPDHPDTLASRTGLADIYARLGRTAEALALLEPTVAQQEKRLGPDHVYTLRTRMSLGKGYLEAGRAAEAVALLEATVRQQEKTLGPDHLDTLRSRDELAVAYEAAERLADARALREATLKRWEATLGPDHPSTLACRNNLATAHLGAGRTAEAVALLEAVLRQRKNALGPDHPDTLVSSNNLASAYLIEGRTGDAVKLFELALEGLISRLGPYDPNTAACRLNLANAYEKVGALARAEGLYREEVERSRSLFGRDNPRTTAVTAMLGENLLNQEKWSQAETTLRECLAAREKVQPNVWSTFKARSMLGVALLGQGKYAEAEPLILSGYAGLKAGEATIPSSDRPQLAEAARRVVALYDAWGKPDQAAAWKCRLGRVDLPAEVFARP